MGPGVMREYCHLQAMWRMGKLPSYRAVLEGEARTMMIQVSGFGEDGSTIAETVGAAKVYRGHLEDRLREKPDVHQRVNFASGERRVFLTALGSWR